MAPADSEAVLANLRRGTVEFCVLALVRDEPRYAGDLVDELGRRQLLTSEGTLYPLLSRLRRDGLVDTQWVESATGPPRRYYRLTRSGAAALAAFRQHWQDFRAEVDHLLEEEHPR